MMTDIDGVRLITEQDMVVLAASRHPEGKFEPETTKHWINMIAAGGVFVDVGAYTGYYTLQALKSGCTAVYCYEPNKKVYERLLSNVDLNGYGRSPQFISRPVAVGIERTTKRFIDKPSTPLTSAGYVDDKDADAKDQFFSVHDVEVYPLDKEIANFYSVSAIKIDVEGAEMDVLKGATRILSTQKPMVITEYLNEHSRQELLTFLKQLGYNEFHDCDGRNLVSYARL